MTIVSSVLTDCQQMLYGRRRIIDTLYKNDPETKEILAQDIDSISLSDEDVICQIGEKEIHVKRKDVLENFWEHRTRTPSYFSYKTWMQYHLRGSFQGWPIAALNYDGPSTVREALLPHIGRAPQVSVDKDGTKRIYFIKPDEQTCTCSSWSQMNENRKELEDEFNRYTSIEFKPTCKHMQWYSSNLNLHAASYHAKEQAPQYNPRICVYHYDYRRSIIRYRVTNDGVKSGAQWLPIDGWKEKAVHDAGGNPTGACWQVLTDALKNGYGLHPYSEAVGMCMQRTSK